MKLTVESSARLNVVTGHAAGSVRLRDRELTRSVILLPDAIIDPWPVASVAALDFDAFESLLPLRPEVVLLGTGVRQQFPDPSIFAAFATRGIGFEVMDTGAACRTYNVLLQEDRRVAAALLLPG